MWQTGKRMMVFGIDSASLVTGERDDTRLMRQMLVTMMKMRIPRNRAQQRNAMSSEGQTDACSG